MIEVILKTDKKVVIETLSRIGIANKRKKILFPSCYLYEQSGKVYIAHFKELFKLARKNAYNTMCLDDELRLKAVCFCLRNWGLIDVSDEAINPSNKYVFVLPYKDKSQWHINHKFNIKKIYNVKKG